MIKVPGQAPANVSENVNRVLVCAPSNAAVDEITRRLMEGVTKADGSVYKPRVVRLGQSASINSDVFEATLDRLVDIKLGNDVPGVSDPGKAYAEKNRLNQEILEIDRLIRHTVGLRADSADDTLRDYDEKLRELRERREKLTKRREEERQREAENKKVVDWSRKMAKEAVLARTQIFCCTLSGAAHDVMLTLPFDFETVIIDEAAQAIELSTLIPLKYQVKRCILVGDPNQLPPTVLSKMASTYSYERSLFVRIQEQHPKAVHLLRYIFQGFRFVWSL